MFGFGSIGKPTDAAGSHYAMARNEYGDWICSHRASNSSSCRADAPGYLAVGGGLPVRNLRYLMPHSLLKICAHRFQARHFRQCGTCKIGIKP